ncbi:MAG: YbdD/YjiX family protein [Gemmatimonadaceae bacterium]|nr:YbdD/YjiX family protein [Gemmatimonadaceae bacterium]
MIQPASGTPHAAPRSLVASAAAFVRRIIGVPDYAIYRSHMESCHPGEPVMTEREFANERLAARYSRPGQRCC